MDGSKPAALVIGGGIAGIQAALDIADAGYPVYLVEREPSIGGRMAQLDKTFPTLDCSSCILTPKMVDVGNHPNIELMTYSEVVSVERADAKLADRETNDQSTNLSVYQVRIRKKPRYVDVEKCTGCGSCAEACRMKGRVINRFNEGISKQAAIYVPFPQAVPLKYTVDPSVCLFLTRGKCGKTFLCKDACPAGAIDFEQQEEFVNLEVGAVIVATGFDLLDARLKPEFGYGVYPEVMTGIEFERLSSASGPTLGKIVVNGREPKDVVLVKCVGSREKARRAFSLGRSSGAERQASSRNPHTGVPYCSRICCMYTAKHAHLVRDRIPDARITVFYMDVRAGGKGYEEFYDRVRKEGVTYRRGEPSEVYRRNGKLIVAAEDTLLGQPVEVEADLVILATAVVPREDAADLAALAGLERSPDGFFQEAHPKLHPVETSADGVFLAGCCQGPKDIPDAVAQAKAAAASALVALRRCEKATVAMER
ncbi:MAG: CoB--CoM heterodisulfide reductase iron-sulfur subunit A family protein [Anaerolineae bacterium]|nr:CoB--CoM heterodisulfide reductase iron-sulfur subunit A family protein [Anaerolineae bacterium]